MVYVDLNMVRAGVVSHPRDWEEAGYHEIQRGRGRYRIVDRAALSGLLGVPENRLAGMLEEWIESALANGNASREPKWSEAVAVGRRSFVEEVKRTLGARARYRRIADEDATAVLRDAEAHYGVISRSKWAA